MFNDVRADRKVDLRLVTQANFFTFSGLLVKPAASRNVPREPPSEWWRIGALPSLYGAAARSESLLRGPGSADGVPAGGRPAAQAGNGPAR